MILRENWRRQNNKHICESLFRKAIEFMVFGCLWTPKGIHVFCCFGFCPIFSSKSWCIKHLKISLEQWKNNCFFMAGLALNERYHVLSKQWANKCTPQVVHMVYLKKRFGFQDRFLNLLINHGLIFSCEACLTLAGYLWSSCEVPQEILLMEEILHQLIGSLSHEYPWFTRFYTSINRPHSSADY